MDWKREAKAELRDLPQMREISMPRQVNKGGFAEEDVASYVSQLVGRIEQLRSELGC